MLLGLTISAIELYMEAEIVIVKIEKHPQEMLLFTTIISFLHFLGLMFLIMKSSPLSPSGLNVNNGEDFMGRRVHLGMCGGLESCMREGPQGPGL